MKGIKENFIIVKTLATMHPFKSLYSISSNGFIDTVYYQLKLFTSVGFFISCEVKNVFTATVTSRYSSRFQVLPPFLPKILSVRNYCFLPFLFFLPYLLPNLSYFPFNVA